MSTKSDHLQTRLINFGVDAGAWASRLQGGRAAANIGLQLTRSAISPAANYSEAQQAESRRDFLHKMQLCLKELCETEVWLRAAARLGHRDSEYERLRRECGELVAIFTASVRSTKART